MSVKRYVAWNCADWGNVEAGSEDDHYMYHPEHVVLASEYDALDARCEALKTALERISRGEDDRGGILAGAGMMEIANAALEVS